MSSSFSSSVSCRAEKTRSFRGHTQTSCVCWEGRRRHSHGAWCPHRWAQYCTASAGPGTQQNLCQNHRPTTETGFGGRHGAAWFLPSWSPALRAQEWEFSLRGALWATSPPPAEAVVDKVSRTPSEGRSRSWDVRTKEARRQDNRGVPVVLRPRVSLPHVFQELVQLEGRKLREP